MKSQGSCAPASFASLRCRRTPRTRAWSQASRCSIVTPIAPIRLMNGHHARNHLAQRHFSPPSRRSRSAAVARSRPRPPVGGGGRTDLAGHAGQRVLHGWKALSGRPNCSRSRVWATENSTAASRAPMISACTAPRRHAGSVHHRRRRPTASRRSSRRRTRHPAVRHRRCAPGDCQRRGSRTAIITRSSSLSASTTAARSAAYGTGTSATTLPADRAARRSPPSSGWSRAPQSEPSRGQPAGQHIGLGHRHGNGWRASDRRMTATSRNPAPVPGAEQAGEQESSRCRHAVTSNASGQPAVPDPVGEGPLARCRRPAVAVPVRSSVPGGEYATAEDAHRGSRLSSRERSSVFSALRASAHRCSLIAAPYPSRPSRAAPRWYRPQGEQRGIRTNDLDHGRHVLAARCAAADMDSRSAADRPTPARSGCRDPSPARLVDRRLAIGQCPGHGYRQLAQQRISRATSPPTAAVACRSKSG